MTLPKPAGWPRAGSYTVAIPEATLVAMRRHVRASTLGGRSCVRAGRERQEGLTLDQWVGHLGECALSLFLTGSDALYFRSRAEKDASPHLGDGGIDLIGYPVDVKASLWRYGGTQPSDYTLFVRDAERHPGIAYVLALVQGADRGVLVHLMGWADEDLVRSYYYAAAGRAAVPAWALEPMEGITRMLPREVYTA